MLSQDRKDNKSEGRKSLSDIYNYQARILISRNNRACWRNQIHDALKMGDQTLYLYISSTHVNFNNERSIHSGYNASEKMSSKM